MFFDTWVDSIRKVQSTWRGVLDNARISWVSVSSLRGIRFRIRISNGRISWLMALSSSIMNMFSSSRIAFAGRSLCTFIGMFALSFQMLAEFHTETAQRLPDPADTVLQHSQELLL